MAEISKDDGGIIEREERCEHHHLFIVSELILLEVIMFPPRKALHITCVSPCHILSPPNANGPHWTTSSVPMTSSPHWRVNTAPTTPSPTLLREQQKAVHLAFFVCRTLPQNETTLCHSFQYEIHGQSMKLMLVCHTLPQYATLDSMPHIANICHSASMTHCHSMKHFQYAVHFHSMPLFQLAIHSSGIQHIVIVCHS